MRLLEMLSDRFGAFETIAYASLQLAQGRGSDNAPPMSRMTADAILEFGDDLRQAYEAALQWGDERSTPISSLAYGEQR
jgi:hypothetical protein